MFSFIYDILTVVWSNVNDYLPNILIASKTKNKKYNGIPYFYLCFILITFIVLSALNKITQAREHKKYKWQIGQYMMYAIQFPLQKTNVENNTYSKKK